MMGKAYVVLRLCVVEILELVQVRIFIRYEMCLRHSSDEVAGIDIGLQDVAESDMSRKVTRVRS